MNDFLDMPKRPQAPKHTFWGWNMKNLETRFQIYNFLKNIFNLLMNLLCIMDHTLFQTSS